jgi:hypothetical protein
VAVPVVPVGVNDHSQTAPYSSAAANKATTDFVGIAVH